MKRSYKPMWVLLAVFAGVIAATMITKALAPKEIVPWRSDFADAQDEAKSSGKPVFVYFTASWCGPCQSMKSTTWANAEVEAALREYVPVKIDIDQQPKLAAQYNVESIPFFALLDDQAQPRKSYSGYATPGEFIGWLAR